MIAPAYLPLTCDRCKRFIAPGESYIVTPDVAGVGADVVSCRSCDPDFEGVAICTACGEDLDDGQKVYHEDCAPESASCSKCGDDLTLKELGKVECNSCADGGDE